MKRMRVYCKSCDTEINSGTILAINDDGDCEICRATGTAELLPDYETPEQYEKRTGKLYPDEGRVWVKDRLGERWWIDFKDDAYGDERRFIVCVNGPLPPPDGWRPE